MAKVFQIFREQPYTGPAMEQEMFGETVKAESPTERYLPYNEAMAEAKKNQPYEDPSDPEPRFANDLHAAIAELLELYDYKDLKLFTAIGSRLDKLHGVDAFVELDLKNNKKIIVTLDVTINKAKGEEHKADVVFLMPGDGLDPKLDKVEYRKKIEDIAQKVIRVLELKKQEVSRKKIAYA